MTAIIEQADREVRVTAERSLKDFLSPNRADMFSLDVPESYEGITVNGGPVTGWLHRINDGDRVVIGPTDAVGTEAIGTTESVSSRVPIDSDLRETIREFLRSVSSSLGEFGEKIDEFRDQLDTSGQDSVVDEDDDIDDDEDVEDYEDDEDEDL